MESANLLKKIHFPKLCLPIIILVSNVINFAIIMTLFLLWLGVFAFHKLQGEIVDEL